MLSLECLESVQVAGLGKERGPYVCKTLLYFSHLNPKKKNVKHGSLFFMKHRKNEYVLFPGLHFFSLSSVFSGSEIWFSGACGRQRGCGRRRGGSRLRHVPPQFLGFMYFARDCKAAIPLPTVTRGHWEALKQGVELPGQAGQLVALSPSREAGQPCCPQPSPRGD